MLMERPYGAPTWVTPLALHITDILQELPLATMRCIQPLLCLSAGSGLRFESKLPMAAGHQSYLLNAEGGSKSPVSVLTPPNIPSEPESLLHEPIVTPNSLKISQARRFLMDRLEQLAGAQSTAKAYRRGKTTHSRRLECLRRGDGDVTENPLAGCHGQHRPVQHFRLE